MKGGTLAISGAASRLVLASTLVCCSGCLFGPPINEPPVEYDTPPIVRAQDIDPPNERIVVIDRSTEETIRFQLWRVQDMNLDDEIDYQFWILTSNTALGPSFAASGTLRVAMDNTNDDVTVYRSVAYDFNPCIEDLRNADYAVVRLRLIDEIPEEQQVLEDLEAYVIDITWDVKLEQLCPTE